MTTNQPSLREPAESLLEDDHREASDVPDVPDVPDAPDTPDVPDASDAPDISDTPDAPDTSDVPDDIRDAPGRDLEEVIADFYAD